MSYYSSFVVKLWVGEDRQMIRGYVQHAGTQEGTHFLALDKMVEFMMGHLDPPEAPETHERHLSFARPETRPSSSENEKVD